MWSGSTAMSTAPTRSTRTPGIRVTRTPCVRCTASLTPTHPCDGALTEKGKELKPWILVKRSGRSSLSHWGNLNLSQYWTQPPTRSPLYQQSPPRSPSVSDEYTGPEHLLVPGTLRGYRAWRLDGGYLRSVVDAGAWQETGNTADCGRFDSRLIIIGPEVLGYHRAPDRHCTCGFYAKHHLSEVEGEFYGSQFVHGSIKAYGKVILGTKGFRAQYAD